MAINTYSDISALVNDIYEDALVVARDSTLAVRLVNVFTDQMGLAPRKVTEYGTVDVNQVGEDDDLASQSFNRSLLSTLTPAEYGAQIFATDSRIETDTESYRRDSAQELGTAFGQKVDTDIFGNFSSLTGGTIDSSGTTLAWSAIFNSISILRANNVPGPYVAVLHPYQWLDLAADVLPAGAQTNAPEFQDEVMRQFFVQRALGVDIFVSSNVAVDANDDATGAVFNRAALAYDSRRAFRLEPERDASRRGWELNATAVYAHGIWRPTYGVQVISDASQPS